ncbi:related to subtilisin-like serine protease [Cephalotrichum gorgonifer]|uniref:Related to subtilisin-like serine protease n=1 Tax=Cephalotrichum gorgonifer TaxID=2041049 RepID=A0AAE8MWA7_9PEZI|nr:related to subtilisin-like serine protease [Cephalotrichum gorgonifer]
MAWRSALLFATLVGAAVTTQRHVVPNRYIIEFEDGADTAAFYSKVDRGEVHQRKKFDYQLFKGASIDLSSHSEPDHALKDIKDIPGVKVWPVTKIPAPNDKVVWTGIPNDLEQTELLKRQEGDPQQDVFSTHVQTQIDLLRAKGLTGKGIKIAVVDSGIDYTHPALGGCFGADCLVSFGTDFYTPSDDPKDCLGHGTHVAGTIAAQQNAFNFTGAAPGVTLGAYKVFGCADGTDNDILIDAFNRAYEDGADIITASIGGPSGWSEEPWGVAVQRIVEKGVPCTLAAGNEGFSGMFYAATASSSKGVLSVGSVDNTVDTELLIESNYTVSGGDVAQFGWMEGVPNFWGGVSYPLQAAGFDITNEEDGCAPWPSSAPRLRGKVALIRRGTCTFVNKARLAAQAGAEYVMFYNNVPGIIPVDVSEVPAIKGVAMVTAEVGEAWIAALKSGEEVVMSMADPLDVERVLLTSGNNITGGSLSQYTSWGPTFELDVRPVIAAPGSMVLSTYPVEIGTYSVMSGTSMATPLVAGVLALLAEARGTLDPGLLERLLANTAKPVLFNSGEGSSNLYAPVPQQGNGIIRAYDAAFTKTVLDKSTISFNDTENRLKSTTFTIFNQGDEDITYDIFNLPAATAFTKGSADAIYPSEFPNDLSEVYAELAFDPQQVTVPAGGEAEITVTPSPPDSLDEARLPVWSGWIALNGSDDSTLHLAYQGVSGSMRAQRVLADGYLIIVPPGVPVDFSFVFEHAPENINFVLPPKGLANQTMIPLSLPGPAIDLSMGTTTVNVEIITPDGKSLGPHPESPLKFRPRQISPLAWDGELADGGFAPEGSYKFRIRALKIFGDEENEEDWEEAETVAFGIEYLVLGNDGTLRLPSAGP